jgi:hypothetical protein
MVDLSSEKCPDFTHGFEPRKKCNLSMGRVSMLGKKLY